MSLWIVLLTQLGAVLLFQPQLDTLNHFLQPLAFLFPFSTQTPSCKHTTGGYSLPQSIFIQAQGRALSACAVTSHSQGDKPHLGFSPNPNTTLSLQPGVLLNHRPTFNPKMQQWSLLTPRIYRLPSLEVTPLMRFHICSGALRVKSSSELPFPVAPTKNDIPFC